MSIKLIALDLDGTLTNRDKVVTPRTKEALMKAQDMGKIVVLASGRPTPGVIPLARFFARQMGRAGDCCDKGAKSNCPMLKGASHHEHNHKSQ